MLQSSNAIGPARPSSMLACGKFGTSLKAIGAVRINMHQAILKFGFIAMLSAFLTLVVMWTAKLLPYATEQVSLE